MSDRNGLISETFESARILQSPILPVKKNHFSKAKVQSLKCSVVSSGGGGVTSPGSKGTGSICSKPLLAKAVRHSISTHCDLLAARDQNKYRTSRETISCCNLSLQFSPECNEATSKKMSSSGSPGYFER